MSQGAVIVQMSRVRQFVGSDSPTLCGLARDGGWLKMFTLEELLQLRDELERRMAPAGSRKQPPDVAEAFFRVQRRIAQLVYADPNLKRSPHNNGISSMFHGQGGDHKENYFRSHRWLWQSGMWSKATDEMFDVAIESCRKMSEMTAYALTAAVRGQREERASVSSVTFDAHRIVTETVMGMEAMMPALDHCKIEDLTIETRLEAIDSVARIRRRLARFQRELNTR